jgi:hypothetical protein
MIEAIEVAGNGLLLELLYVGSHHRQFHFLVEILNGPCTLFKLL